MNGYKEAIGRINYGLFLVVVFLLPFPQIFLRYACVIWFAFWLLEGRWLQRPKSWKENPMMIPFLLFGGWYLWNILSGLWAPDYASWAAQMERFISFGVLIPVGIWGLNEQYNWRQAGRVLIISCVCAVFFYLAFLTVLLYHREIIDYYQWVAPWDYSSFQWWHFYQMNLSHVKHRLFLSSIEMFALILIPQVWPEKAHRWLRIVLTVVLVAGIVISGSRQAILMLLVVGTAGCLMHLPKETRLRYGRVIVLSAFVVGAALLALHPRMQSFDLQSENRILLWKQALAQPSDYLWTGLGAGQTGSYLTEATHCHNQYLQELMELGVFGLLLFLGAWISVPLCAQKRGKQTALLFTILYACNMCTDCMFAVYCGVALWSVGLLFILIQSDAAGE